MARSSLQTTGHIESIEKQEDYSSEEDLWALMLATPGPADVKIMVVGERNCGKTSFIEVFHNLYKGGDPFPKDGATVYPCKCEFDDMMRVVEIYEIPSGPEDRVVEIIGERHDTDVFVLVYAIDDPSSFEKIHGWINLLTEEDCWMNEPGVLIGNKKDIRLGQQLEQDNQVLVTREQGNTLAEDPQTKIKKFYECSSLDKNSYIIMYAFLYMIRVTLDLRFVSSDES